MHTYREQDSLPGRDLGRLAEERNVSQHVVMYHNDAQGKLLSRTPHPRAEKKMMFSGCIVR